MKNILTNIVIISLLLSVLLSNSQAKVMVNAAFGGYPVAVCQPNDTGSGCTGTGGSSSGGGSGNVGIGTTGWDAYYATSGSTVTATKAIFIDPNSNVGIGTTIPLGGLSVMNGNVGIGTWAPGGSFIVQGGNVGIGTNSPNILLGIGATNQFNVNSNGNLGIGVINPAFPFQVTGAASGSLTTVGEYQNSATTNNSAVGFTLAVGGAQLQIQDIRTNAGGAGNSDFLFTSASGGVANRMLLQSTGNVGIGTTIPLGGLAIMSGNVGIGTWIPGGSLIIQGGNVGIGTNSPNVLLGVGATDQFNVNSNGNVGIGTFSTTDNLTISGSMSIWNTGVQYLGVTGASGNPSGPTLNEPGITSGGSNWDTFRFGGSGNKMFMGDDGAHYWIESGHDIRIGNAPSTIPGTTAANNMTMDIASTGVNIFAGNFTVTNGNVGVGSATPGQLLDVFGTVRMPKLGTTLSVASGSNGCQGQAILSSGTVTVSTTCTPATSQGIFLQDATTGSLVNIGVPTVGTVTSATSFVINSSNALDSSNVNWWIMKSS